MEQQHGVGDAAEAYHHLCQQLRVKPNAEFFAALRSSDSTFRLPSVVSE